MKLTNTQARRIVDKDGVLERQAVFYSRLALCQRGERDANVAYFEARARCYALAAMWGRLAVL